jgi:hypothetical protein
MHAHRAPNALASQASDPSALLEGMGDDSDFVTTTFDLLRSTAEGLEVNAIAPATHSQASSFVLP